MFRFLALAALISIASARFLATPQKKAADAPKAAETVTAAGKSKAAVAAKPVEKAPTPGKSSSTATKSAAKKVSAIHTEVQPTAKAKKTEADHQESSDVQRLSKLQEGLKVLSNLHSVFEADHEAGGSEFAEGALSNELGQKDSEIWGTIQNMMTAASKAQSAMKSKDKATQDKAMASLEKELNDKADTLHTGLEKVSVHQKQLDEEYVLGLLNMHKNWSLDQQLDAISKFTSYSPMLAQLYKNHSSNQPLAMQLATLMDAERTPAHKAEAAVHVQAAKHAAAKLFIQLADSFVTVKA